ncbi:helix-turn-helix domain-containing protein [Agarivorans sp. 1_MG-2023]|uniref:helix-turn-helix domain-containing protein n=1 Tax=Agarivorans sp. 1_MG-2023 TaxID=3062634 RepID=UPI0026E23B84|nr:helix-turn-helix transcriptional regulator [Agarivorans sp. 1_MG-2023]MDO6763805.1 helix-turn-helix transcriptional regulator [Agarivorans sp. 1_MG-2023]
MSNYKNIADYIQQKRKQIDLTQEQLCQELSVFSPEFNDLDSLAISRWERGKVEPSLNRQVEIISYFGDQAYQIFTGKHFSSKNLPSMDAMNKLLEARTRFKHYMGAHPYLPKNQANYQRICPPDELADRSCNHLSHYIDNLTAGLEQWDSQWLQSLQNTSGGLVSYYFYLGQLGGHSYALKVKPVIFDQLLNGDMSETELRPDMLASRKEPGYLYIFSIYTGRVQAINYIYEHIFATIVDDPSILHIGLRVRRDIAHIQLDNIPHYVTALGPVSDNTSVGIKYQGKRYQYICCQIERQALINAPIFLNILRNE